MTTKLCPANVHAVPIRLLSAAKSAQYC